jgi:hypothetical protein
VVSGSEAEDTKCGQEYFAEGMGTNVCEGQSCSQLGPGYACADCTGGEYKECGDKRKGSACIQAQWIGSITWGGTEKPMELVPFAVCGYAQGAALIGTLEANMFKMDASVTLKTATAGEKIMGEGMAPYSIKFAPGALDEAKATCVEKGNTFSGVVLGLKYMGLGKAGIALTTPVGAAVEVIFPGTFTKGGYAILTEADCRSGGRFSGYADVDGGYVDAFWCGMTFDSTSNLHDSTKQWPEDEIAAAIGGSRAILCDIAMSSANAPDEPTEGFYKRSCTKETTRQSTPSSIQNQ